jgi:NADPH:quinone reductase-like Zn-dependent oxidoreductase
MRCVLIKDGKGPVENLYLGEEPTPSPKKGEVLVKVGSVWVVLTPD